MKYFYKLPNDIKLYIKDFIFIHCDNCSLINYFWKIKKNIIFYEYLSIFDDNFTHLCVYNQKPISFQFICLYCYEMYVNTNYYIDSINTNLK